MMHRNVIMTSFSSFFVPIQEMDSCVAVVEFTVRTPVCISSIDRIDVDQAPCFA